MSYEVAIIRRSVGKSLLRKSHKLGTNEFENHIPLEHGIADKSVLDNRLRSLYEDIIKDFPPMNGPDAATDAKDWVADYFFFKEAVIVSLGYSQIEDFFVKFSQYAEKYGCALYVYGDEELYFMYRYPVLRRFLLALLGAVIIFSMLSCVYFLGRMDDSVYRLVDFNSIKLGWWAAGSAVLASLPIWLELYTYCKQRGSVSLSVSSPPEIEDDFIA